MPLQSATYTFQDLSGPASSSNSADPNPYKGLIEACNDHPAQIQARYSTHRSLRTTQQRALLLAPDFPGMNVDPILVGVTKEEERQKSQSTTKHTEGNGASTTNFNLNTSTTAQPREELNSRGEKEGFVDHRHNFSFWARPPVKVRSLVGECQKRLKDAVPDLWLMPHERLHMTTLEIFDSRDAEAVDVMRAQLEPLIPTATDFTHTMATSNGQRPSSNDGAMLATIRALPPLASAEKRARLVHPMLSYDATAVALTWLPAAADAADAYTYHHLRRDMWELLSETSSTNTVAASQGRMAKGPVEVKSRYVVPSAHLTIARNINRWDVKEGHDADEEGEGAVDHERVAKFVKTLDEVNEWLKNDVWVRLDWVVGAEQGLDCRAGTSWFGGGHSIRIGKGF